MWHGVRLSVWHLATQQEVLGFFGRWSWEHYKLLNRPPRYPNLVSDETLPSLWRWLRAETSMERSECTLADIGRVISPPDQIVGTCPGALLKIRVRTPSLGKLGPNYIAYWHTNQIAWSGNCIIAEHCISVFLVKVSRIYFSIGCKAHAKIGLETKYW